MIKTKNKFKLNSHWFLIGTFVFYVVYMIGLISGKELGWFDRLVPVWIFLLLTGFDYVGYRYGKDSK